MFPRKNYRRAMKRVKQGGQLRLLSLRSHWLGKQRVWLKHTVKDKKNY